MNADSLHTAMRFLRAFVAGRVKVHTGKVGKIEFSEAAYCKDDSPLSRFVEQHRPSVEEYVLLLLSLAPHIQPHFFSDIIAEHFPEGGDFPEFGGVKGANHRGILPTGETAQFILAGDDVEKRLAVQQLLGSEHWFAQRRILWLEPVPAGEPVMSGRLVVDPEIVEQLTVGKVSKPRFSVEFPAEHIETEMGWDDLVLHPNTLRQIREIENWIIHNDTLLHDWGMKKRIKPGYRALFYGPPGTGKTLTATLLGKHTGRDVFRIDLSRVVSKYIGETEKNLSRLFDKAEHKNWILFFDEADALFGKRTDIRDAHDKYANQEIAYLLQRLEEYAGLVILASNMRNNVDEAFTRRLQSIIAFTKPQYKERLRLWENAFSKECVPPSKEEIERIAQQYDLAGGSVINVVQYASMLSLN